MQPKARSRCAVERLTAKIGGKWKVPVLWMLCVEDGPLRFGELRSKLQDVSAKMLSQQLKELERDKFVLRRAREPRQAEAVVEYELTDLGRSLKPVLIELDRWSSEYLGES